MYMYSFQDSLLNLGWYLSLWKLREMSQTNFLEVLFFITYTVSLVIPPVCSAKTINRIKVAGRRNIFQSREYLLPSCGLQNQKSLLLLQNGRVSRIAFTTLSDCHSGLVTVRKLHRHGTHRNYTEQEMTHLLISFIVTVLWTLLKYFQLLPYKYKTKTRLHSSRMRTARLLPVSPSMHCAARGCVLLGGGCLLPGRGCLRPGGRLLPRGVSQHAVR